MDSNEPCLSLGLCYCPIASMELLIWNRHRQIPLHFKVSLMIFWDPLKVLSHSNTTYMLNNTGRGFFKFCTSWMMLDLRLILTNEVLGFRFYAEGSHPITDKTAAITNTPSLGTKKELHLLLVLTHYNPGLHMVVTANASLVGIGTVLAHVIPRAHYGKIIEMLTAYASLILYATERAYL
ncbi:hypothetical protein PR048_023514 [Dryococelus australis]|uniref:Uncharacterized protein n=1 Tax=Dryococelus australis TaxID=614101 RepID=A0ABQ9GUD8_9NEOP|nr:hypothetical protein PR048_023514 [Dryococelus australis]